MPHLRQTQTILGVFAHPDDDVVLGPMWAHYGLRGVKVYLAFATSGDQGATAHARIPAGAELAAVREREAQAACKAYGIEEPVFFRQPDRGVGRKENREAILRGLTGLIESLRPSVIVTFGPEGVTHHPDHLAIGNLVSEVFQRWRQGEGHLEAPRKLYYVVFPPGQFLIDSSEWKQKYSPWVDTELISTEIDVADGAAGAAEALQCYQSQFSPQTMRTIAKAWANALMGKAYLRLAMSREETSCERDLLLRSVNLPTPRSKST